MAGIALVVAGCCTPRVDVRMMSYNIRHGAGLDGHMNIQGQADVIRAENPDFVGLQEVDVNTERNGRIDERAEYEKLTGLHATFAKAIDCQGGDYGVMVLSRMKPLSVERIPLPGNEPRVLLICEFPQLYFGTTHLCSASEKNRLKSVDLIGDVIRRLSTRKPVYLTGDWNAVPKSAPVARMSEFMKIISVTDCQTYHGGQESDEQGNPFKMAEFCIDYISVDKRHSEEVDVTETHLVEARQFSDHVPMTTSVSD